MDAAISKAIRTVQELELVSMGYRISANPPAVTLVELSSKSMRCVHVRGTARVVILRASRHLLAAESRLSKLRPCPLWKRPYQELEIPELNADADKEAVCEDGDLSVERLKAMLAELKSHRIDFIHKMLMSELVRDGTETAAEEEEVLGREDHLASNSELASNAAARTAVVDEIAVFEQINSVLYDLSTQITKLTRALSEASKKDFSINLTNASDVLKGSDNERESPSGLNKHIVALEKQISGLRLKLLAIYQDTQTESVDIDTLSPLFESLHRDGEHFTSSVKDTLAFLKGGDLAVDERAAAASTMAPRWHGEETLTDRDGIHDCDNDGGLVADDAPAAVYEAENVETPADGIKKLTRTERIAIQKQRRDNEVAQSKAAAAVRTQWISELKDVLAVKQK
ncbi:hypothetical protein HK101_005150 [Irineochytrium annulatum]|nr:hypothetical protein HK101_005150 [Irineochytrium annulatum]